MSDPLVDRLRAAGCVFAEEEAALLRGAAGGAAELERLAARRETGEPLEHVVGWARFLGLRVAVGPGVFVPRPRTELLGARALHLVRDLAPGAVVVELCCGAGALALAVALAAPHLEVHAADVDPGALAWARRNLEPVGAAVHEGDLWRALPGRLRGRVDLLLADAPYVPTDEVRLMPAEARLHEPRVALDGGGDGLDVHRRLLAGAPAWLAPGARLLLETGASQADADLALARAAGLAARVLRDEDLDATCLEATAP
ncbi:putative protein N(5)-glutamine methyltransferase [Vallicoccus soli]|uniref:peptide chain release factor N(5)-glutamine methyltransferase n=1 Tax=Vallicoccus soli TaxID=2339232 RepID=A0A3A3YZ55_9ACTN|nr:putative protein N(5)-glutamine methyltransferase [Vallicoccus soli]RJK95339.1 putative protein N(5)-glutamine methyltransferase [Vallicoccus soli]